MKKPSHQAGLDLIDVMETAEISLERVRLALDDPGIWRKLRRHRMDPDLLRRAMDAVSHEIARRQQNLTLAQQQLLEMEHRLRDLSPMGLYG